MGQSNNNFNPIKVQNISQGYSVTVQSQVKLHSRSISSNHIPQTTNPQTQINSDNSSQKLIYVSTSQNQNNFLYYHKSQSKSPPSQNNNKSDSSKEISQQEFNLKQFNSIIDAQKSQINNSQQSQSDKKYSKLKVDGNISVNSNEQDSTTPSNSENPLKLKLQSINNQENENQCNLIKERKQQIISKFPDNLNSSQQFSNFQSKNVSPTNNQRSDLDEQYPSINFKKSISIQLMQRKQSPIKNIKLIQQPKAEQRKAVDTILFMNPSLFCTWFNKKDIKNSEFKSVYTSLSSLSDVMPDIDQGNLSLMNYKLRKLKDLNVNDQRQQWEDLQVWMRNHFDTCYSRNSRISNSIQGYLVILEDCYKNNFNFRSKLGEFYKKEVIKNNINTHETSSLIIRMQQNRLAQSQKKLNKNKTDTNFFNHLKFKSESNLESMMSPLSKKQKSKRQSVHSSQNLDVVNLASKLQSLQDNLQLTHQINEEDEQSPAANQKSKRSSLNSENKDFSDNDEQKESDTQLKKDQPLTLKKNLSSSATKKKRYNSLPKMRYLKDQQQQENMIQGEGNNNIQSKNQQNTKGMLLFNEQFLQQPNSTNVLKVNQQGYRQKPNRTQSPLKISSNANDYGIEYKTKVMKLSSNQCTSTFLQPNNVQSIQQIENDYDQDRDDMNEDNFEIKQSITLQQNNRNKVIKIKSVHNDKDEFDREGHNSSSTVLAKVRSTIQQQQQDTMNQNQNQQQISQNLLSKSLSKVTYQSKIQQEKNLLIRMGVQKSTLHKASNPSIHQDQQQRLPSNDIYTESSGQKKLLTNDGLYELKAGRASPVSSSPSKQKEIETFSSTVQNFMVKNGSDSPYNFYHNRTRENFLSSDKKSKEVQYSNDKKNSTCVTPYSKDQISELKNVYKTEIKPLFSEKFKLIIQKTQQQPTSNITEFDINSNVKRNITSSESKDNKEQIEQSNGISLERYEISSQRKTKRSESAAHIKYFTDNREDNNYYVSSTQNIDNQTSYYGRGSDLILSNKYYDKEQEQNSMNVTQENNNINNYNIPNQKDFIKMLQSTQFKSNALNPHVKQKTSTDFFQQIYAKVQMNRRLLQSSQIRRQNTNQVYFETYFQNNKQQHQPKEQLPFLPQEQQIKVPNQQDRAQHNSSQLDFQSKQQNGLEDLSPKKGNLGSIQQQIIQKPEIKYNKYEGQIRSRDKSSEKTKPQNQVKLSELKTLMVKGSNSSSNNQPQNSSYKNQS